MLLLALLLPFCQRLELEPRVAHPQQTVHVQVLGLDGHPQAGVEVSLEEPDGQLRSLGFSKAKGEVKFVPQAAGKYVLSAVFPDQAPVVFAVYHVEPAVNRWLYAVVLTPLGLLFLWWNLRRMLRPEKARSLPHGKST